MRRCGDAETRRHGDAERGLLAMERHDCFACTQTFARRRGGRSAVDDGAGVEDKDDFGREGLAETLGINGRRAFQVSQDQCAEGRGAGEEQEVLLGDLALAGDQQSEAGQGGDAGERGAGESGDEQRDALELWA